jgi:hypothetical protein
VETYIRANCLLAKNKGRNRIFLSWSKVEDTYSISSIFPLWDDQNLLKNISLDAEFNGLHLDINISKK